MHPSQKKRRSQLQARTVDPGLPAKESLERIYGKIVADHCLQPRNFRKMDRPDGYSRSTAEDGDLIEWYVRIENKTLTDCTFQTNGCAATIACGSLLSELAKNKRIEEAFEEIAPDRIIAGLEGLPEGNHHCALLVSQTLRLAIADGLNQNRNPWKKLYRRN